MTSKYIVGIDLGTTNCALGYCRADEGATGARPAIEHLSIPQLVAAGEVGQRAVLPSFAYLPSDKELPPGASELPWKSKGERVVGTFARDQGSRVPGRLVASAKSWLSHSAVDRRGAILPWTALADVHKISPVEASAAYLSHLRDAWNTSQGKSTADRLAGQEVYLTVPASFDAAARELTVEAARLAGLENLTLLEEPQAAFYAWIADLGDEWRRAVKPGDLILVCDVGGGTTDFSLIGVAEADGDLSLNRLAVGEHILLGGDNMDLALAHTVAESLPGGMNGLDAAQRVALTYACRQAKETLFTDGKKQAAPVAVLGRSSRVVGGALKTELTREQLHRLLLEGFFPICDSGAEPERGRRMGLTEIGLPYASDAAVTRHLAHFLGVQAGSMRNAGGTTHPTAVLFNGGVFQAEALRQRVLDALASWAGREVPELKSTQLDLAVARGAAYYGLARRGRGIRIRGGTSRSYYIGFESSAPAVPGVRPHIKAVCVVPMGMEEGTEADVPGAEFGLVVGETAEFRFLSSTVRRDEALGAVLDRWEPNELEELEPLVTTLPPDATHDGGQSVPVRLHSNVTEVGTLDLWCHATRGSGRWKLQYNVRESTERQP
jgi:molecular chaperone DnaK (HSP70)